jgi:hypothetical protein
MVVTNPDQSREIFYVPVTFIVINCGRIYLCVRIEFLGDQLQSSKVSLLERRRRSAIHESQAHYEAVAIVRR